MNNQENKSLKDYSNQELWVELTKRVTQNWGGDDPCCGMSPLPLLTQFSKIMELIKELSRNEELLREMILQEPKKNQETK